MNITPLTKAETACFGVCCERHQACQRYHAAEGAPTNTIATCDDGQGNRPLFVAVAEAPKEVAA